MWQKCSVSGRWRVALAVLAALAGLVSADAVRAMETPSQVGTEELLRTLMRQEALALENGEGVARDPERAAKVYCEAARLGDAESQYNLGWMYTNGRGVERNDTTAAFFFNAAAEQGLEAAVRMLARVGGPPTYVPECMQERVAPAQTALAPAPKAPPSAAGPIVSNAPPYIRDLVKKIAPEYKVHPQLALSIIEVESNFDTVALSPRNAKGLMQLIPETAARFNVRSPYDPAQNIRGGVAYLRWLLAYFEGDIALVAAAYNAGEGAVNRYRGVPPYAETRAYVRKVLAGVGFTTHPFDTAATAPSPQLGSIRDARRH